MQNLETIIALLLRGNQNNAFLLINVQFLKLYLMVFDLIQLRLFNQSN